MALIKTINNITPSIASDVFLAETATIIGDVSIAKKSSLWYNTILRGDVNSIIIGEKVNIQDGSIIHCTFKKSKVIIGNNVSIGHNSIIHGCKIGDNVLIGMGAIIMDHAIIESNSIVAAGSVVTKGTIIRSGNIFSGTPAKIMKEISEKEVEEMTNRLASNYAMYSNWYT